MGANYQWYFNSLPMAGQTNDRLVINPVNAGNAGNYFATVANVYGAVTSSAATLSLISAQPARYAACTGTNLQLSWAASNGAFQLQSSGNPLGPWRNLALPMTTNAGSPMVTVGINNQQQYFRLYGN